MENRASILQMARGAIQERVDYEVGKAVDNILDLNTDPTAKRKITLTIEMKPDENRQYIKISSCAARGHHAGHCGESGDRRNGTGGEHAPGSGAGRHGRKRPGGAQAAESGGYEITGG